MKIKFTNKIKKNAGQITVEYILLAVALTTLFHIAAKILRDNGYLKNFQELPNKVFVNLIENGNWKIDEIDSRNIHPNQYLLHYTPDGTGP